MAWTFSTAAKNARADAIKTYAGAGAQLQLWTTGYGTKLVQWAWTGDVFAAASSGAVAMNAPTTNPVTPLVNGTAAIARLVKSDGTTVVMQDLTVGTSGTDVVVTNTSIVTTAPETLLSFGITEA